MKRAVFSTIVTVLMAGTATVAGATIGMSINPDEPVSGENVQFQCAADSSWDGSLRSAKISISNSQGVELVSGERMDISGNSATYGFAIPSNEDGGTWSYSCELRQGRNRDSQNATFVVADVSDPNPGNNPPVAVNDSASTPFETQVTVDVPANDSDVDGNLIAGSVTIMSGPTAGTAVPTSYGTVIYTPATGYSGNATFVYEICDAAGLCDTANVIVTVAAADPPVEPPVDPPVDGTIAAHNSITKYNGPATCIGCHEVEAEEMLQSLHMQWSGPTPDLTNTDGGSYGKAEDGINTFCTYAMSSKGACFSCHVRADGNDQKADGSQNPPTAEDVDCLMCHNDTYQRKFVSDPDNTITVTQLEGTEDERQQTYTFGKVDSDGNYIIEADFAKMPAGTNMVNIARTVHMPTNTSCLRCHAKAGGGDWTKRGDMGLNSANATVAQDVHLAKEQDGGAGLSCVDCHSALNHKIAGRGIDLRQTEAVAPTCNACHTTAPHSDSTLNRHAQGQVSCQVCHIREYAKGGETEMSRDWTAPSWNQAFCSGQGGFVGHEVKEANVKPDYVWFDGTSYVYNVGETIEVETDAEGPVLHMARANGQPFDGRSKIVPIKRHFTNMPFDDSGRIIPPAIMWMFMTGNFDIAVQEGLKEQAAKGRAELYTGNYEMYRADAEMLITHGVDPKSEAPSCIECHNGNGTTPDGSGMVPFDALGYHEVPASVESCTLCHDSKNLNWENTHSKHRGEVSCSSCHTPEPTGVQQGVCSSCHENKSWYSEGHKKHVKEKGYDCIRCHTFS